jgi:glycosyltransferase involved in cell wall biosynthesis
MLSVILCTHNPAAIPLQRVLNSLSQQSLNDNIWDIIVVDSGSHVPITKRGDIIFPPKTKHIRVNEPGLARARLAGFSASRAGFIASLDDDTVVNSEYLQTAITFLQNHVEIAVVSGRVEGEFEVKPPDWINSFESLLAIRNLGEEIVTASKTGGKLEAYPQCSPLGVNVARRSAIEAYLNRWEQSPEHAKFGRNGKSLASGEDNDFALCVLQAGGGVAYHPEMVLTHIIPQRRLDPKYLAKLNRASSKSWIQVLALHDICAWPAIPKWTVPLRKLKAWFAFRAWAGPGEKIRWSGACGQFEGQASISKT